MAVFLKKLLCMSLTLKIKQNKIQSWKKSTTSQADMLVKGIVYSTEVLLDFDCLCGVIRMEGLGPSSLSGDSQRQCCFKGYFSSN